MKISYHWLKNFLNTNKTPQELSLILTNIGLEVESLEKRQSIPGGLEGLIIGEVIACQQHPNADRLRVTKVNIGNNNVLDIVCGAPNVGVGQKVIVATVGCTVYPLNAEPFKINKSKIRGEVSEGMICAEDEIGLGKSHDGILILPNNVKIGQLAKDYFNIQDDWVFEIGLTPNRADAASHLGVARDLAAYLKQNIATPSVEHFQIENSIEKIAIEVLDVESAPRYSGITISNVKVAESPQWLKDKLNILGIKAINNIVDITNFILHDLGQPLHAFDLDNISGKKIIVKKCAEGTLFTTLDGVERKLSSNDLMICDSIKPLCIAGVYGGQNSGVTENTTSIFLESAYFNPVSVRKTSKKHNLKTDASFRYERGTDPEITVYALKRAALLIKEIAGGTISSDLFDFYPTKILPFKVTLKYENVKNLIGVEIPKNEIKSIIEFVGIHISNEFEEELELEVPTYKVDVTREVDVIEEILRIYGYNNIEIPSKVNASLNYVQKPDKETIQNNIADVLSANGFYEILSNSLTKATYAENQDNNVKIINPLSSDLEVLRQSLLYSGLEAIQYNLNRKHHQIKFFEFGKTYAIQAEKFVEQNHLAIFLCGVSEKENWFRKSKEVSFYEIKSNVDQLLKKLGLNELTLKEDNNSVFDYSIKYVFNNKDIVEFGAVKKSILKKIGIDKDVFYADFNWDAVLKAIKNKTITFKELSKFPKVRRDLSLLIDKSISYHQLHSLALKADKKVLKEVDVFDVYMGDKVEEGKKSYALSFYLQDDEKTLTDKQIDSVMQKVITNLEKEVKATVRK